MEKELELAANILLENKGSGSPVSHILRDLGFNVNRFERLERLQFSLQNNEIQLAVIEDRYLTNPLVFLSRIEKYSQTTRIILIGQKLNDKQALNWVNSGGFAYYRQPVDYNGLRKKLISLRRLFKNQQFLLKAHRELIKKLRHTSERLSAEVQRDELTGLATKGYFQRRGKELIGFHRSKNAPLSVLIFDIDYFKKYNDSYGHPQGDRVLEKIGEITRSVFRQRDPVARIGGEEFAVLLPRADHMIATKTAERLRKKVERARFSGEERLPGGQLTVSVGTSTFPTHADNLADLIELADRAMYHSKKQGRNRVTETVLHQFRYKPPGELKLRNVEVVGDFNNWRRGEELQLQSSGIWAAKLPVPRGQIIYGYLVNGTQLIADPSAPVVKRPDGKEVSRIKTRARL